MTEKSSRKNQAKLLRTSRKIHRTTGALLFVFFFFIAVSGVILGWKKQSGGYILPKSQIGTSTNLKDWLPVDRLHHNACTILRDSIAQDISLELDKIEIVQHKGMAKFVFKENFWEIQIDGATGRLLQIAPRRSDLIENIHDGSILDDYFGITSDTIKLAYTTVMGGALLVFTITGFWLWYGPKRMRKEAKTH